MTPAKKLRHLRDQAGIAVEALAKRSGLTRAAVYHFEAGTRKPSLETTRKICKALGKSLAEFDQ